MWPLYFTGITICMYKQNSRRNSRQRLLELSRLCTDQFPGRPREFELLKIWSFKFPSPWAKNIFKLNYWFRRHYKENGGHDKALVSPRADSTRKRTNSRLPVQIPTLQSPIPHPAKGLEHQIPYSPARPRVKFPGYARGDSDVSNWSVH